MSVGIGKISKGLFQKSIENVVNNEDEKLRSDFLTTLRGNPPTQGEDWIGFLRNHGGLDRVSESYIRDQWLQFWEGYNPSYTPEIIKEMLRQSLIEAIDLADKHKPPDSKNPLPIECHWIWTDNNDAKFEVLLTYNKQQVTRILLTPPPPTEPPRPLRFRAPYFIVKLDIHIDREQEQEINPAQEQEPPGASGPRVYQGDPRVVTVQLKSTR